MKYILSITGDCNDGDYLTENIEFSCLNEAREIKGILEKLKEKDDSDYISEYDFGYCVGVILKYLTIEEIFTIGKICFGFNKDSIPKEGEDDELSDFINEALSILPSDTQSDQNIHSIKSIKILQEIN